MPPTADPPAPCPHTFPDGDRGAAAKAAAAVLAAHRLARSQSAAGLADDIDAVCQLLQGWKQTLAPVASTRLTYRYRDASNYKQAAAVVFAGAISADEKDRLFAACQDRLHFIPHQVGLTDLQTEFSDFPSVDDHVWHELVLLETCNDRPETPQSIHAFVAQFTATAWDEAAATGRLGLETGG